MDQLYWYDPSCVLIFKETVRREDGAYYCHRNNHHYSASEGILFYLYLLHLFSPCNLLIDRLLYHHQVIAFLCGALALALLVMSLASTDWLLAHGWRQGLFLHCVDEMAERPLPFGLEDKVGCYRVRDECTEKKLSLTMPFFFANVSFHLFDRLHSVYSGSLYPGISHGRLCYAPHRWLFLNSKRGITFSFV